MGVMHACNYPGCAKQFDRKYNLKCHLRIHSNEKPYRCHHENCSRSFRWKSSLNHHLMSLDHTSASVRRARKAKQNKKKIETRLNTAFANRNFYSSIYESTNLPILTSQSRSFTLPSLQNRHPPISENLNSHSAIEKLDLEFHNNYLRNPFYLDDLNTRSQPTHPSRYYNNIPKSHLPITQPEFNVSTRQIITDLNTTFSNPVEIDAQRIWSPNVNQVRKDVFTPQIMSTISRNPEIRYDHRRETKSEPVLGNRINFDNNTSWQHFQGSTDESIDNSSASNVTSPYGEMMNVIEQSAVLREKHISTQPPQHSMRNTDVNTAPLVSVSEVPSNMVINGLTSELDSLLPSLEGGTTVKGFQA